MSGLMMVNSFKFFGMNGLSINVYRNYIFIRTVFLLEIFLYGYDDWEIGVLRYTEFITPFRPLRIQMKKFVIELHTLTIIIYNVLIYNI